MNQVVLKIQIGVLKLYVFADKLEISEGSGKRFEIQWIMVRLCLKLYLELWMYVDFSALCIFSLIFESLNVSCVMAYSCSSLGPHWSFWYCTFLWFLQILQVDRLYICMLLSVKVLIVTDVD